MMQLVEDDLCGESSLQSAGSDLVELKLVEEKFRNYLDKLLLTKFACSNLASQQNSSKSKFQLESSINKTFINMKKLTVNNSNKNDASQIAKCDIQWPHLLLATLEYLLSNSHLNFQAKRQISLEKFVIYCNLSELQSYDWINNVTTSGLFSSVNSSPTSSVFSGNSDNLNQSVQLTNKLRSNYLAAKYPRKSESETVNKRRRISDDGGEQELEASQAAGSPLIDQSSLEETYHLGEMFLSNFEVNEKCSKNQRLMHVPEDSKFQEFLSLLNAEKNQSQKFDTKLVESSSGDVEGIDVLGVSFELLERSRYLPKRVRIVEPEGLEEAAKEGGSFDRTLEEFLGRLNEEKMKNEQFNAKLDSMLNY